MTTMPTNSALEETLEVLQAKPKKTIIETTLISVMKHLLEERNERKKHHQDLVERLEVAKAKAEAAEARAVAAEAEVRELRKTVMDMKRYQTKQDWDALKDKVIIRHLHLNKEAEKQHREETNKETEEVVRALAADAGLAKDAISFARRFKADNNKKGTPNVSVNMANTRERIKLFSGLKAARAKGWKISVHNAYPAAIAEDVREAEAFVTNEYKEGRRARLHIVPYKGPQVVVLKDGKWVPRKIND